MVAASVLAGGVSVSVSAQVKVNQLTPAQVDQIVTNLESAAKNYVFPDIAAQL
jgi:hypothetical protein